jgi:hypothetical protein
MSIKGRGVCCGGCMSPWLIVLKEGGGVNHVTFFTWLGRGGSRDSNKQPPPQVWGHVTIREVMLVFLKKIWYDVMRHVTMRKSCSFFCKIWYDVVRHVTMRKSCSFFCKIWYDVVRHVTIRKLRTDACVCMEKVVWRRHIYCIIRCVRTHKKRLYVMRPVIIRRLWRWRDAICYGRPPPPIIYYTPPPPSLKTDTMADVTTDYGDCAGS